MTLNKQQKKAVEKIKGPTIILAGAGTGKTYTIVEKIKFLVDSNEFKPEEILCLTFSNEATNSLKKKVQEGLKSLKLPTIRTFHGFCLDILKEDGNLLNLDNGFNLLLPDDAKVLIHKSLNISPYWTNRYLSSISTAKDFGIEKEQIEEFFLKSEEELIEFANLNERNIDELAKEKEFELNTIHLKPNTKEVRAYKKEIKKFLELYKQYSLFKNFLKVWEDFEKLKKSNNYLDYGDLNYYVLKLFRKFGAEKYVEKFKYVIIDEFQDTNKVQFELIEYIAGDHGNITVVGDPNQSIYGFRGSYKESFNHFMKTFGASKEDEINLVESWRSSNRILNVAHDLIKNNYDDENECFKTFNAKGLDGEKVKIIESVNADEEARIIADLIEEKVKEGVEFKDICVLFRTHKQGDFLRDYLRLRNIPISQIGRTNLLMKKEIKIVVSYLAMLNNIVNQTSTGEQGWWKLFHYKNILSMEDSLKIGRYLKKNKGLSIDEVLLLAIEELELSEISIKIINDLVEKLRKLVVKRDLPLEELVLEIYEISGLNRAFSYERYDENILALMNLKKFYSIAKSFREIHGDGLNDFVDYLEVLGELGISIEASELPNENAVKFMTIHGSKGLEFDVVIVSNLAESRFPVSRTQNEPLIPKELLPDLQIELSKYDGLSDKEKKQIIKDYENRMLLIEERRLAYVAFTRAKKELILTFARDYKGEIDSNSESVFLNEIGYENWNLSEKTIENENIFYVKDDKELNFSVAPNSIKDKLLDNIKKEIITGLDVYEDISLILNKVSEYKTLKEGEILNFGDLSDEDLKKLLAKVENGLSGWKFDKKMITLSPSALLDYVDCPKKFELGRILQMPQRRNFVDEVDSADIGTFVHKILEDGVNKGFKSEKEFLDYARELVELEDLKGLDFSDVERLIKTFWVRNQGRYNENSQTEVGLSLELDGFKFFGLADRIDELEDGSLEIIDYKTNKNSIDSKKRNFQLGYYALACRETLGRTPSKLTLEMLRLEKPFEMKVVGDDVLGPDKRTKPFNLNELKEEFIEIASSIKNDFETEFKTTEDTNKCKFCGFKFYCPKWEE